MEVLSCTCGKLKDNNIKSEGNNDNLVECNCTKTAIDVSDMCLTENNPNINISKSGCEHTIENLSLSKAKSICNRPLNLREVQVEAATHNQQFVCHNDIAQSSELNFNPTMQIKSSQQKGKEDGEVVIATRNSQNTLQLQVNDKDIINDIKASAINFKNSRKANCSDAYHLTGITSKSQNCLVYEPVDPWTKMNGSKNWVDKTHKSLEAQNSDSCISNISELSPYPFCYNFTNFSERDKSTKFLRNDFENHSQGFGKGGNEHSQQKKYCSSKFMAEEQKLNGELSPEKVKHVESAETVGGFSNEEIVKQDGNIEDKSIKSLNTNHNPNRDSKPKNDLHNFCTGNNSLQKSCIVCAKRSKEISCIECLAAADENQIEVSSCVTEPLQETRC